MKLTRTEKKLYQLLSDGKPHKPEELAKYLWDEFGVNPNQSIRTYMSNIRFQLPAGYDIASRKIAGKFHYLLVKLIENGTAPVPSN